MRCQILAAACVFVARCACAADQPEEAFAATNYDEVIRDLVSQLDKDRDSAKDAAQKLANLGRRAVPVMAELLEQNFEKEKGNQQIVYTTVWALSRVKHGDAAKPLLPVLKSQKAAVELRAQVLEALSMEFSPDGIALMQEVAAGDADESLRKKAYAQLSLMPTAWAKSEKLFTDALSDPSAEIRAIAAKQCYFCRIYLGAADKLIHIVENENDETTRINAILALGRMRIRRAVPALVRVCVAEGTPEKIRTQVHKGIVAITTIPLKDAAAVPAWWAKFGEAEYAKLEIPKELKEAPKPENPSTGDVTARKDDLSSAPVGEGPGVKGPDEAAAFPVKKPDAPAASEPKPPAEPIPPRRTRREEWVREPEVRRVRESSEK